MLVVPALAQCTGGVSTWTPHTSVTGSCFGHTQNYNYGWNPTFVDGGVTKSLRAVIASGSCNNQYAPQPYCPAVYYQEWTTTPFAGGLTTTAKVRSRSAFELSNPGRCETGSSDADSANVTNECRSEVGGGETWCDPYCTGEGGVGQRPARGDAAFVKASFAPATARNRYACCIQTPLVLDLADDGFALSDAANGVYFDFNADGVRGVVAWLAAGSDDAWLVLDRNGNGRIDDGGELFGNVTPQPNAVGRRNGFQALAEFDRVENGGNGDGAITDEDAVYASLRLWQDANHDGFTQPGELSTLLSKRVSSVETSYKEIGRKDEHGNEFRYKATAIISGKRQKVYDVILTLN